MRTILRLAALLVGLTAAPAIAQVDSVPGPGPVSLRYSEGTWTPTPQGTSVAGSTTCGTAVGWYIRIQNLVVVNAQLSCTGAGTMTGNLQVTGLPYTVNATAAHTNVCAVGGLSAVTFTAGNTYMVGRANVNTTVIDLLNEGAISPTAATSASQPISGLGAGTWTMRIECSYQAVP